MMSHSNDTDNAIVVEPNDLGLGLYDVPDTMETDIGSGSDFVFNSVVHEGLLYIQKDTGIHLLVLKDVIWH